MATSYQLSSRESKHHSKHSSHSKNEIQTPSSSNSATTLKHRRTAGPNPLVTPSSHHRPTTSTPLSISSTKCHQVATHPICLHPPNPTTSRTWSSSQTIHSLPALSSSSHPQLYSASPARRTQPQHQISTNSSARAESRHSSECRQITYLMS